jgi:LysM repeat protein
MKRSSIIPAPKPPPRLCPLCGTRASEMATRCLVCGTDLSQPTPRIFRKRPRRYYPNPYALALLAALAFAGLGLLGLATGRVPLPTFLMDDTPTITPTFTPLPTITPTGTPTHTPLPTHTPPPPLEYVVVDGDSCLLIALNYDVSVESIIMQNNLDTACTISVGRALLIPRPTPSPTPRPSPTVRGATAGPSPTQPTPIPVATYVVQAGDTCLGIALQFYTTVEELSALNGLSNCAFIREGQVLEVPLAPLPASATATPAP